MQTQGAVNVVRVKENISLYSYQLGVGFVSAVVVGIVSGLGLRLLMKIVAVAYPHMARGFTWQGTMFLVLTGIGFCLLQSLIYSIFFRNFPYRPVVKGLLFGAIILTVYGIPFFLSNPDNDLLGPQAPLAITLFSILFIGSGTMLAFVYHRLENWALESAKRKRVIFAMFVILILPAIVISGGIIFEIFTELIPAIRNNLA